MNRAPRPSVGLAWATRGPWRLLLRAVTKRTWRWPRRRANWVASVIVKPNAFDSEIVFMPDLLSA
jgi:hypothetical protein